MQGQIVLVTGANSGIGYYTSLGLAQMGATVLMVARDAAKGEQAQAQIAQAAGSANLHLLIADLSSIAQVKALAEQVESRFHRLDVLVNNAGLAPSVRTTTADGLELQFAVNHLAGFILSNRLLPVLSETAAQTSKPSRIVNVSSSLHRQGSIDFDNLQCEKSYPSGFGGEGWGQYNNTKLMNILFTYEMARRLGANPSVTVNVLHPGAFATGLTRYMPPEKHASFQRSLPSPEQSARTSIYLASSPEVAGVTGAYYEEMRSAKSSRASHDEETARRLWEVSAKLAGIATI
jgi:NAD(P)-dependent dehydrogenase (short-subunit alcohol dehydrogenase family)